MIVTIREALLQKIMELGQCHPFTEMRFGQLMLMVCLIPGKEEPAFISEVDDNSLYESVEHRLSQPGRRSNSSLFESLSRVRQDLQREIENLGEHFPEWPLGKLVFNLASLAHTNEYDIEDEELLAAARSTNPGLDWFHRYNEVFLDHSTQRKRENRQTYQCPCCQNITLFSRGDFDICPVCYWEDDGQDNPDVDEIRGGPNGVLSLSEARRNYQKNGVFDLKYKDHVRQPKPQELFRVIQEASK
jgi:hypothetical protein